MSVAELLLAFLCGYNRNHRCIRRSPYGSGTFPVSKLRHHSTAPENTIRVTLSRLKKLGFVENEGGVWAITVAGRRKAQRMLQEPRPMRIPRHSVKLPEAGKQSKRMVVIFDIPERKRNQRDWLRTELKILGFIQLQKSVWFGPTPLPKTFVVAVQEMRLLQYMKFYRANEYEIV